MNDYLKFHFLKYIKKPLETFKEIWNYYALSFNVKFVYLEISDLIECRGSNVFYICLQVFLQWPELPNFIPPFKPL